jgi:ComF family protein
VDTGRGLACAAFTFDGAVREVLHRGKFQGNRAALRLLASLAAERLDLTARPEPDAVAAIPLGARRRRQRGYNQAEIVATVFAAVAGRPLLGGLVRERETAPQASRGEAARRANVAGAFGWRGAELAGASVWLVDDVLTTGATVEAAASVLRHAGASRVDALVIARVP